VGVDPWFSLFSCVADEDGNIYSGRSWRASELRLKSFDELHQLWFVLLKEKNRLVTDLGARENARGWSGVGRLRKVKESMARIKTVLKERAIVYQDTKARLEARQRQWLQDQKKLDKN
jgi:large subunit ribosomal protein L47